LEPRLVRRPRAFDDTARNHVATRDNNTTRSNNTACANAARNASSCCEVNSLRAKTRRVNSAGFHFTAANPPLAKA
jgi:hypothetical protein